MDCTASREGEQMRILIIGAGRTGTGLARWFRANGLEVQIWNRSAIEEAQAQEFSRAGIVLLSSLEEAGAVEFVMFCTADAGTLVVASEVESKAWLEGQPFLFCSGSLDIEPLRRALPGRGLARVHPAFPFCDKAMRIGREDVINFLVESDSESRESVQRLLEATSGRSFFVDRIDKDLYHAGCVFSAGFVASLLGMSRQLLTNSGLTEEDSITISAGLASRTLKNVQCAGGGESVVTGPSARGETQTVVNEVLAIARNDRLLASVYELLNEAIDRKNPR